MTEIITDFLNIGATVRPHAIIANSTEDHGTASE
jgi:hypothetical protein